MNLINVNLKVLVMDTDFYALQAVNSYLAWDRRTRVIALCSRVEDMWKYLKTAHSTEHPDIILLDADHLGGADSLQRVIKQARDQIKNVRVICLAQTSQTSLVEAAATAGASGFLLKQEVRLQIAWAIVYALNHDFIITHGLDKLRASMFNTRVYHATTLPEQRDYPELTDRIRQAIQLCVVEGMPAQLAADEMGISLHTIRGYIKEGYRIMEAYDEAEYPVEMSPQERAFMRFTAFADTGK